MVRWAVVRDDSVVEDVGDAGAEDEDREDGDWFPAWVGPAEEGDHREGEGGGADELACGHAEDAEVFLDEEFADVHAVGGCGAEAGEASPACYL
jgi:hypothetical protein